MSYSLLVHQLPLRRYMSDVFFLQFHLQLLSLVSLFNVVEVEIFSHRVNGVLWLLEKIIKIEKSITRLYSHQRRHSIDIIYQLMMFVFITGYGVGRVNFDY